MEMDQYLAIRAIRAKLREVTDSIGASDAAKALAEIDEDLQVFHDYGIDFKEVADSLDDSLLITDAHGVVIYLNPAYTRNTGIAPEEVLGRDVQSLIREGLMSGGAVMSVLEDPKRVLRLSTTYKTDPPIVGYVVGSPIFDDLGNLRQVVACSRPIVSLKSLQSDFETFVREVNSLKPKSINRESGKDLGESLLDRYGSLTHISTLIDHVAPTDASILITGESGAGKEVVADEIYRRSLRADKPYVKINCTSIPAHLLESELFGYEKGAFTGASTKGKMGLFEYANNGTLLLDEIGDMPMDLQVKLLRAIQSQEITRIGGTKPIKLNVRFLALTNADLKAKVADGTFRQDLYYRLNVIPLRVPPLRERAEDMEVLCAHFTGRFCKKYDRPFSLTPRQLELMKQYRWPGNIRELENLMEYLIICSSGIGRVADDMLISLLNLGAEKSREPQAEPPVILPPEVRAETEPADFNTAVARFEAGLIREALASSATLREAGEKLNLNASTICRKIKLYDIPYDGRRK